MTAKGPLAIFSLACCMALQSACNTPTKTEDGKIDPIVFSDLKVGQTSSYISFAISGYWSLEQTFKYTYDSLITTVTAVHGDGYLVTERFVDTDTTDWWIGNYILTYLLHVSTDSVGYRKINSSDRVPRIFASLGSPGLALAPVPGVEVTLDGWRPIFTPGECCLGTLDGFEVLGHTYGPLNVYLLDITPVDGPAMWWLYSGPDGIVRHMYIDAWTGSGKGWDLLP